MRRRRWPALVLLPLGLLGCSRARTPDAPTLSRLETFAERVTAEGLRATWEDRRPLPFGLAPLLALDARTLDVPAGSSPELARRAVRLRDRVVRIQLGSDPASARVEAALAEARRRHALGDEIALERLLTESDDPDARRLAWMARADAARELAPLAREAARARNEWARRTHGLPFLELWEGRRGVDRATARRLRVEILERLGAPGTAVEPWDTEASSPELVGRLALLLDGAGCLDRARGAMSWVGLPADATGLTLRAGRDASGHSDYGTFQVDPPRDVRVRVAPEPGLFPQWATLHELGHAAQGLLVPAAAAPGERRPAADAVSEGCAKVFERLAYAPEWLRAQGAPDADVDALGRWERASERARMRSILADTAFEEELYRDPDGDLDAAHARLLAEIEGVRAVQGVPSWALRRTVLFEPLGRLDYLLARCAQAAIYRRLRGLPGGLLGTEAGRVTRDDVLAAAAGARYEEWFARAAGTPCSCEAWLVDVAGVGPSGT